MLHYDYETRELLCRWQSHEKFGFRPLCIEGANNGQTGLLDIIEGASSLLNPRAYIEKTSRVGCVTL